jgi:RNA recognition motif-containing protein
MRKIYVGNLPFSADELSVRTLFAQHGTVNSIALVTDRHTGQSRGYAFIDMPDDDAERAIRRLDGHPMDGKSLSVSAAREKQREIGRGPRRW